MVAVCVVMAPCVAFVGVPMSTITVSSASSMASVAMVMVMLAVVLPALMVIGLPVIE
jgi:hypothetical protein